MSALVNQISSIEAIRLVSLPCELQTTDQIATFVSEVVGLGKVLSINIVQMKTDNGIRYRSAFVDIETITSCATEDGEETTGSEAIKQFNQTGFIRIFGANVQGGFHFDNGKPMDHIKITPAKSHRPTCEPLALEPGAWMDLYIPMVPPDLTMDNGDMRYNDEHSLAEFIEDQLKLGRVTSIEYTTKNVCTAVVHFECWFDNQVSKHIRDAIDHDGNFKCDGFYDGFEFSKFDRNRYIVLKRHVQVAHRFPSATLTKDSMTTAQLLAKIEKLEDENKRLRQSTTMSIPGMDVMLDVGTIIADNHRLKEKLAFEQLNFTLAAIAKEKKDVE
jgi:hypothetical protein